MSNYKEAHDFITRELTQSGDCEPPGGLFWKSLPIDGAFGKFPGGPPTQEHSMHFQYNCCDSNNWCDAVVVAPHYNDVPPSTQRGHFPKIPTTPPPCPPKKKQ
jgi:hypothetical protein